MSRESTSSRTCTGSTRRASSFLANHVDAVQGAPGLTIVNFRPQYQARWMSKSYYGQIALVPLGPEAIAEMLEDLIGTDPSLAGCRGC